MKDKLNPDAEAALRKLILEIWGFQIETEDFEEDVWAKKPAGAAV
jgi:hypothetical protein